MEHDQCLTMREACIEESLVALTTCWLMGGTVHSENCTAQEATHCHCVIRARCVSIGGMPLLPSQRPLFDIPHDVAYFNCAYHGPQLNEARRRLIAGVTANSHPWERTPASFFEDAEAIRRLAAELFGGDVDGYATIPSVSYGMSTAARAMEGQFGRGDSVLTIAEEFPSTVLTWRRVAQTTGATLRTVPTPAADADWTTAILNHIDASTKVLSISTCHWTNGAHIDVAAIGRACRDADCVLVIDASQSLGAVPFSIADVQPDFLIAAGYKWLLCPYGASLLYVADRWRDARPLEEHWQARENAEDFKVGGQAVLGRQ